MNETFSDLDLLQAVAIGDREALALLYDRYERLVYGLALRIIQDAPTAEEIVQDAFTRVWQKGHTYDPAQSKFSTWLLQVARNRALDIVKQRRRQQETVQEDTRLTAVPDRSTQTEERVLQNIEQQAIREAMEGLSSDQRDVIRWIYFQGLTQQEITDRFHIPLGTVKSRVRLALHHLKNRLTGRRKEEESVEQPVRSSL